MAYAFTYPYYEADPAAQERFRSEAFIVGYRHGCLSGGHVSPRAVYERFPRWSTPQVEAYLNGRDDGVAGDTTRFVPLYDAIYPKAA